MSHDFMKHMVEDEERSASFQILATLLGGMLLVAALLAERLFPQPHHAGLAAMAAAIFLGAPLVWQAFRDLWRGGAQMYALAALGVVASFAAGHYITSGAISLFMLLSTLVEYRSALGARRSIEALIRLKPTVARRLVDGREELVDPSALAPGDVIRVRPGENVPGDGSIVTGRSTLDESSITGESLPAEKGEGHHVFAGTVNVTGVLEVCIERSGQDTTLEQVRHLILEAESSRTPAMRLVDRYAGWYTPIVLMLAGLVLFFTRDITRVISMLVIACPCAIVLAGPTAAVAALSAAARLGILIKNVRDLEAAGRVRAVAFDKTGTLTRGRLHVVDVRGAGAADDAVVLALAAGLEAHSNHPVAGAVRAEARRRVVEPAVVLDAAEAPGLGMTGTVEGRKVVAGRAVFLRQQGVEIEEPEAVHHAGTTLLYVGSGSALLGWIELEDEMRPGARELMKQLEAEGMEHRVMLTGDRRAVAEKVAADMGCTEVHADLLPGQKRDVVRRMKDEMGLIAAVGDGTNDAPALAEADVSVAMGAAGSDVAIHAASIALMNNELNRIPFLFHLSHRLRRVVRQNLVFASGYVLVLMALSAAGRIHPVAAVLLHTASGFVILFNSARLVREGENLEDAESAGDSPPEEGRS